MKPVTRAIGFALLCLATMLSAQGQTVVVTSSSLGGITPITGSITFQPTLPNGVQASARLGGGGQTSRQAVSAPVVGGVLNPVTFTGVATVGFSRICGPSSLAGLYVGQVITGVNVPSGTQIVSLGPPGGGTCGGASFVGMTAAPTVSAASASFSVTGVGLPDTSATQPANMCYSVTVHAANGLQVLGPGYTCVQPAVSNSWCTAGVCNFDNYAPNISPLSIAQAGIAGVSTTTGAPGTSAAVSIGGTPLAAVLAFTIPRGADGAPGAPGAPGATGGSGGFTGGAVASPITLPADPTQPLQATTKQYVDAHASTFTGGSVTNPITLPADPTLALQASTKQYVDAHVGGGGNPGLCTTQTATIKCITAPPYSADPTGVVNSQPAFQSAINALSSTGGSIVGDGNFLITGALQDPTGANAVLVMPVLPYSGAAAISIALRGSTLSPANGGALKGMTLSFGAPTSGNGISGYDAASSIGKFTAVRLSLEKVNLTTTATNPGFTMLNACNIAALSLEHVFILSASGTIPTNAAGVGLITPCISNNVQNDYTDLWISGWYTGGIFSEHSNIVSLRLGVNHDCAVFDAAGNGGAQPNSITGTYIWAQPCVNYAVGPPAGHTATAVNIAMFDMESDPGTGFSLSDPNNLLTGQIGYKRETPSGAATISGGNNVAMCDMAAKGCAYIAAAPAPPLPTAGLIEIFKSQDGSGTILANTGTDSTNSATATAVTWTTVAGFTSPVATYNGTSSFSEATTATQTAFDGTSPFSACVWFKQNSITSVTQFLLSNLQTGGIPGWVFGTEGTGATNPGDLLVRLRSASAGAEIYTASGTAVISAATLTQGCFTYDGTKTAAGVKFYINGVLGTANRVGTDALVTSMASTHALDIGDAGPSGQFFGGALGGVKIYNRLLTASDVSALYAAGANSP